MVSRRLYMGFGILLGLISGPLTAQYFENPSFEGVPGLSVSPPSWIPFGAYSTPDTEPVECDDFRATHGNTYLTLVARGADHKIPNSVENVSTSLLKPMEQGRYYRLIIDLASRKDLGHFSWEEGFVAYTAPVKLRIFAGSVEDEKGDLLSESDPISDSEWMSHSFILLPEHTCQQLLFEVELIDNGAGSGNLLLDLVRIEEIDEPPLDFGDLVVPNVFTPNGDGINDKFAIRGLSDGTYLFVFDRSGKEVYNSISYANDWNGNDSNGNELPPGTYWYVLFPVDMSETTKGFVYLKREL